MLIIYQDVSVSVHGVCVLIGLADRRLFCTSDDLVETFYSPASTFCTISGDKLSKLRSSYMLQYLEVLIILIDSVLYNILYYRYLCRLCKFTLDTMDYCPSHLHISCSLYPSIFQTVERETVEAALLSHCYCSCWNHFIYCSSHYIPWI